MRRSQYGHLTEKQFDALATIARLGKTTREAARLVYVNGMRLTRAAVMAGCLPQSLSRALRKCERARRLAAQALGYEKE